ncbi:nuclear transport factor 2 family protein [Nocardia sp. NPDC051900]|uniref:nuclear transport factor 2 family protein n=1 Tax=Nocardia sp. NPDC051900 TaxID=3364326 RepID=UPI00378E46FD
MDLAQLAAEMQHSIGVDSDFFYANSHPDLVVELPYAPWVGRGERVVGREMCKAHMEEVGRSLPGLRFLDLRVTPLAEEDTFLLEYIGFCPALDNYRLPYICIYRFKDDKLILFREYWDTSEGLRVFGGKGNIPESVTR